MNCYLKKLEMHDVVLDAMPSAQVEGQIEWSGLETL